MARPKLTVPVDLDWCNNVLVPIPIALIPHVGGLLEILEYAASWVAGQSEAGYQIAIELQRRLIMSECENTIAAAIDNLRECVCQWVAQSAMSLPAGPGTPDGWTDYDDDPSTVQYLSGDPPSGFETWDAWLSYKCKASQYVADLGYRWTNQLHNVYVAFGTMTWGLFVGILTLLGVTAPVGVALAACGALAVGGLGVYLQAQRDWLLEHRREIVCAIFYDTTAEQARQALRDVFDDHWTLDLGDRGVVELIYCYQTLNKVFDGGFTVDQLSEYDDDYCDTCTYPEGSLCDDPITVSRYTGTFTVWGDYAVFGLGPGWPDCPLGTQTLTSADIPNTEYTGLYDIHGAMSCRSGFGPGNTVGYLTLQGFDTTVPGWITLLGLTFTTTESPMVETTIENDAADVDFDNITTMRITANNQAASCKEDPGPGYVLEGFCFTLTPAV